VAKAIIEHVETRQKLGKEVDMNNNSNNGSSVRPEVDENPFFDIFITLKVNKKKLLQILRALRQGSLAEFTLLKEQLISIKGNSAF
jgi:hypothetical protein